MNSFSLDYIDDLYAQYIRDPESVSPDWRKYFEQFSLVNSGTKNAGTEEFGSDSSYASPNGQAKSIRDEALWLAQMQDRVDNLVREYRVRGHLLAKLDPLKRARTETPELDPELYGLSEEDLAKPFTCEHLQYVDGRNLGDILEKLRNTYCRSIGAQFMHIDNRTIRDWLQRRMENCENRLELSREVQCRIYSRLADAAIFEEFVRRKFVGAKTFSLEGAESLIPLLDLALEKAGQHKVEGVILAMAHRGRLNVLVNTLGKNPKDLFDEFDGKKIIDSSGDVKYHQGFSSNVMTPGGEAHLALSFNPSHLEIASPVVEGSVRARQNRREDTVGNSVLPIIMHGDAAFAGQGVVMETFQMSQTRGYRTGGSIHIVINNQVGFTTNKRIDARSTEYCTDVAKMIHAPILHVNGDDPEAVLFATQVALDYRNEFKSDVVIDLVCYRRRGHNEADEPSGTQPLMYNIIKALPTTRTIYADKLIQLGFITEEQNKKLENDYRAALDNGEHVTRSLVLEPNEKMYVDWGPYLGHEWTARAKTGVALKTLQRLGKKLLQTPDGFPIQRQVQKIIEDRNKMNQGALPLNWGYAETMAYATLINEGHEVRITGQDVGRGTFSHRHAVLHNQQDGSAYIPLANLADDQPRLEIYDSLLSEEAVLAFEYGYSTTNPNSLVVWEAQFGDFANGAQVVIDQFITSGEQKWGRLCGLTMLLPHGYEGQGPEHSSARLERYLQLCAQHNIQVCVPSTPSQVFHMLRRQIKRPLRKPLVAITPKSLLRHKEAISTLDDLSAGTFHTVLEEIDSIEPKKVSRVIMCIGKVYYDLLDYRRKNEITDTAIVRIEQLYPFPNDDLVTVLSQYPKVKDVVWCQEEPQNQGAWYPTQHRMRQALKDVNEKIYLRYAGREGSASPAAGYTSVHVEEQAALVKQAFDNE